MLACNSYERLICHYFVYFLVFDLFIQINDNRWSKSRIFLLDNGWWYRLDLLIEICFSFLPLLLLLLLFFHISFSSKQKYSLFLFIHYVRFRKCILHFFVLFILKNKQNQKKRFVNNDINQILIRYIYFSLFSSCNQSTGQSVPLNISMDARDDDEDCWNSLVVFFLYFPFCFKCISIYQVLFSLPV